ncbi:MAG: hypothetical protein IPO07_24595 [Haliscomenobacter sp.]|nr:hypothetical protein [Haliscomenobacter sp.]
MLLTGCSTTKSIPENDALYTGARIKMTRTEVSSKQKKALQSTLEDLTRPKPNSRVLGIPFKLWLYNLGSKKGLGAWLRRKYGEAPVLLSEVKLGRNAGILDNYLENRGFFQAKVQGDTTVDGKKPAPNTRYHRT